MTELLQRLKERKLAQWAVAVRASALRPARVDRGSQANDLFQRWWRWRKGKKAEFFWIQLPYSCPNDFTVAIRERKKIFVTSLGRKSWQILVPVAQVDRATAS